MPALRAVVDTPPDIVVLDLGLPDVDGADLLRMIRAVSDVPVMVATARDDEADVVRLLDAGADEYVVKPFSGAELEARVRALLRRVGTGGTPSVLVVGGIRIDLRARTVEVDGREVSCNRKEFDLLAHLAANAGTVVARDALYAEVWREPYGGGGQDDRRAPLVAPTEARRDRRRAPLPPHGARCGGEAGRPRPMRRRLVLVFIAVSTLVATAFVVPLGFLVRRTAEDRAIDAARVDVSAIVPALVTGGSAGEIEAAITSTRSGSEGRVTVFTDAGEVVGPPIAATPRVEAALNSGASAIGEVSGGVEIVAAVASGSDELAAVRVFVPSAELHRGQWRAWLVLGGVGLTLVAISVAIADRPGQGRGHPHPRPGDRGPAVSGAAISPSRWPRRVHRSSSTWAWRSTTSAGGWRGCSNASGSSSQSCRTDSAPR